MKIDQKKEAIAFLIVLIIFPIISASITTTSSNIFLNPTHTQETIEFTNSNISDNSSLQLSISSELTNIIQLSFSTINFPSERFTVASIKSNAPAGYYNGKINYAGGYIDIAVYIASNQTIIDPNSCQLNPSIISYSQTYQQGTSTELPKIIFNPTNCNGTFSITSAYISGGITTSSGQKPVYIKSASSTDILLGVDTSGLSSLTYSTKLTVVAFGKTFTDISTITIIVTGGTNPNVNFDINHLPTCSLTNNILNLNSSYSLVCTNLIPDVSIVPKIDNNFIRGTGVDQTSNQFIWYFNPKKLGNTIIEADFNYLGITVGDPFIQEVKIQSGGITTPGTNLAFYFTPKLEYAKYNEPVIIQLIDNKSGSLVVSPEILVDAKPINISSGSFQCSFESGKEYEIRGKAPGYDDLVQKIKLNPKEITISISPSSGNINTFFNITPSVNSTMKINGIEVASPYYGTLSAGINIIESSRDGYNDASTNLTVESVPRIISGGAEFKKGVSQEFLLNKNSSFLVFYQTSLDTDKRDQIFSGSGDKVIFTPEKNGFYTIEADGRSLGTYSIEGFSIFNHGWLGWAFWIWGLIFFGLFIFIIIIIYARSNSGGYPEEKSGLSYSIQQGGG